MKLTTIESDVLRLRMDGLTEFRIRVWLINRMLAVKNYGEVDVHKILNGIRKKLGFKPSARKSQPFEDTGTHCRCVCK